MRKGRRSDRRGAAAVVAIIFLALIATLATVVYHRSATNIHVAYNMVAVDHASANAEAGMRWIATRFQQIPRPGVLEGIITQNLATSIWGAPGTNKTIADALADDLKTRTRAAEQNYTWNAAARSFATAEIRLDDAGIDRFVVEITPLATDARVLQVVSTGFHGAAGEGVARRDVTMQFLISKFLPWVTYGNNQVQLGANTLVEGNIAMRNVLSGAASPVLCISDFNHMADMKARMGTWRQFLKSNSAAPGNRIPATDLTLTNTAIAAGYTDQNNDGFIDEYDLFLRVYDTKTHVKDIPGPNVAWGSEFSEDLRFFEIVNLLGADLATGVGTRSGYNDELINNLDKYAKVRGQILLGETFESLRARLGDATGLSDVIQGPISPNNPASPPIVFDASDQILELSPKDFADACDHFQQLVTDNLDESSKIHGSKVYNRTITTDLLSYSSERGSFDAEEVVRVVSANGLAAKKVNEGNQLKDITVNDGVYIKKKTIDAANSKLNADERATYQTLDKNYIIERFPYGSATVQATFKRPIFRNMTFSNCRIPKGLNAVFQNCTFTDVTFVDTDTTVGGATDEDAGRDWAQVVSGGDDYNRAAPLVGAGGALGTGQLQTNGSTLGNNIRFDNCRFEGPLTGTCPKAYTHHANSWEFTGTNPGSVFENVWQDITADNQTTVTILSPQVNIEMGSFGDQAAASKLLGVVVGGNVDIRGTCTVDGALISLRDRGTMTLGYFGPDDSSTDPDQMPEGGYGRILLRQNPLRALPYGMPIPVNILPAVETYRDANY